MNVRQTAKAAAALKGSTVGPVSESEADVNGAPAVAPNSDLPGTILSIQILRFVAALGVVIFHAHIALTKSLLDHRPDRLDHAFGVGASGVHIFFVISGFVMVYTTLRSGLTPGTFLSRRLVRIYPIYWVMAATYFIAHLFVGTPYRLSFSDVAGAALLLPGASPMIIGPGWTLSFEMYFYICFALALFAGLRRGLFALSIFYLASVAAGFFVLRDWSLGRFASDSLLLEFVAGAWLAFAFERGLRIGPRTGAMFIGIAVALFASGVLIDYERIPSVFSWGIPSLLLVAGGLAFEPQLRSGIGRSIAKMGDSSYLLYLSHVLLIDLLIATPLASLNHDEIEAALLALPAAAICTIAAAFGYEWIERPLLSLMKRWVLPRRNRQEHVQRPSRPGPDVHPVGTRPGTIAAPALMLEPRTERATDRPA